MLQKGDMRARRAGFTLMEVLVTIAIVATLAAVLLPALNNQLSKGDATRVGNDLLAVQTAISTFSSDTKRYPGDLSHLTTAITASLADINSSTYPSVLSAKWKGPYLAKGLTDGNLPTGFGGSIVGDLDPATYNGINYVRVEITPLTLSEFNKIDEIIDETASSTGGQLRYDATGSGTASFFAVPIQ